MRKYSVWYLGCIPPKCSVRAFSVLRATMNECLKTQESGLKPKSFTVGCHHHAADGRTAFLLRRIYVYNRSIQHHSNFGRPYCGETMFTKMPRVFDVLVISRELQLVQVVHNFPQDARSITPCNSTVQVLCLPREHKLIEQHFSLSLSLSLWDRRLSVSFDPEDTNLVLNSEQIHRLLHSLPKHAMTHVLHNCSSYIQKPHSFPHWAGGKNLNDNSHSKYKFVRCCFTKCDSILKLRAW